MDEPNQLQVLITAGPTREFFDDVRFISNRSSGRMGVAIARAFAAAGANVTLVAGPCEVPLPDGAERVEVVRVVSANDMLAAVGERFDACQIFVAAAAVADYRPAERADGKLKKSDGDLQITLVANPDILFEMGQRRTADQFLVGFALEVQNAEANAAGKLQRKNCDVIVLNSPANFGDASDTLRLISHDGEFATVTEPDKEAAAAKLVAHVLRRREIRQ